MYKDIKILIKFPTRGRPDKFFNVLDQYISKASDLSRIAFLISMDYDDIEMNNDIIKQKFEKYKTQIKIVYFYGNSKSKIQACNADIDKTDGWDMMRL